MSEAILAVSDDFNHFTKIAVFT